MPSNYLILYRPLLLLPSIFSSIGVFSNESVLCNRWPKHWSFSFSISPSNEYSGLIYFRMDWLDCPEKAMAPHSSSLAWKIPWMEESGGLQSMGSRSRTRLSDFTFTFHSHALEKEMATHSSTLAWKITWMEEPGRLCPWGHKESDTTE